MGERTSTSGSRAGGRDLGAAGIVFGLVLAGTWLAPLWPESAVAIQATCGAIGCALIVARSRKRGIGPAELGARLDNLPSSFAAFSLATSVLCAPAIMADGGAWSSPFPAEELPAYWVWASLQQFVAVGGFWLPFRLASGSPPGRTVGWRRETLLALAAAAVFALAHAPNLGLMVLAGLAETIWLLLFGRFRNFAALSLAHAAAALVVSHHLVPSPWLRSMTVGLAYGS